MEDQIITLNLSVKNINLVLEYLGEGKHKVVRALIDEIAKQGVAEVEKLKNGTIVPISETPNV